jgi:multidrug efflux pump subunit AcrA (membrane-fusion protein)
MQPGNGQFVRDVKLDRASALLLGFVLLAAAGCDHWDQSALSVEPSNPPSTLKVNAFRLKRDDQVVTTVAYYGKLVANRSTRLSFSQPGRVKAVVPEIGAAIDEGETLALLDLEPLEQQKTRLQQQLESAIRRSESEVSLQPAETKPAAVLQLEAELQRIDEELERGRLRAPYSSLVAAKFVETGSLVTPQTSVIEVIENTKPVVEANLPSKIVDALSLKQAVWVLIAGQAVEAELVSKAPLETLVGSKSIRLSIVSELDRGTWSFGQTVEIRFLMPTGLTGYWLPISSLLRESDGIWSALVVAKTPNDESEASPPSSRVPATVHRRTLEIVQLEDEWVLAQGSIQEGDWVIANGIHRIVSGQTVSIVDVSAEFEHPNSVGASE